MVSTVEQEFQETMDKVRERIQPKSLSYRIAKKLTQWVCIFFFFFAAFLVCMASWDIAKYVWNWVKWF